VLLEDNVDYIDDAFNEIIYNEFGVIDELDILSEQVNHIIQPTPGIIILITQEFYGKE
tara:strand:+ start:2219 stop:2392 length:174 start_codon:yes stop_codon:yes gene_type:complete